MTKRTFPSGPSRTGPGERYGPAHRKARATAVRLHRTTDPCQRCGKPLGPMGPRLHYDHDEHGGYLGFSHEQCNRLAGASKGGQVRAALYGPWKGRKTAKKAPRRLEL